MERPSLLAMGPVATLRLSQRAAGTPSAGSAHAVKHLLLVRHAQALHNVAEKNAQKLAREQGRDEVWRAPFRGRHPPHPCDTPWW